MPGPILPPSGQQALVPAANQAGSFKTLDIITQAMLEIGAIDPNEAPSAAEANTGLSKLNMMLDLRNANGRYIYAKEFRTFTLVPSLQPHIVGPGANANLQVAQRPVKILDANIILNNSTSGAIRQPVNVRDADWWANKRAFAIVATFPTDLYFEPDWPNGSLFLWPVPNTNYPLELEVWSVLGQLSLTSDFSLPPAYWADCVYSLAVSLCPSFGKEVSPTLMALQKESTRVVQMPNSESPRMGTRDFGIPEQEKTRPFFNYLTGQTR